jgi:molybdopterin/thiamine biosynthesis adenylyltransferase
MSRRAARVLVVGVGGIGCPVAIALARAGVGTLGLVDDDEVEISNLHRQILFSERDVGSPKVDAAAGALRSIAPGVRVEAHRERLVPSSASRLVAGYDLVVEGSDNFATKFLTADACVLAHRPVVQAAAVRWHGTALAVGPSGGPCYRCLFEDLPREDAPNCAEAGVMGPVVGVVGALAAGLALEAIDGANVAGTLVTYEGKTDALRRRTIQKRAECMLCGARQIHSLEWERYVPATCIEEGHP